MLDACDSYAPIHSQAATACYPLAGFVRRLVAPRHLRQRRRSIPLPRLSRCSKLIYLRSSLVWRIKDNIITIRPRRRPRHRGPCHLTARHRLMMRRFPFRRAAKETSDNPSSPNDDRVTSDRSLRRIYQTPAPEARAASAPNTELSREELPDHRNRRSHRSTRSILDSETDSDSDSSRARARGRGPPLLADESEDGENRDSPEHEPWETPPPLFLNVDHDSSPPYVQDPHVDEGSNLANVRSDRQLAPVRFSVLRHTHSPHSPSRNGHQQPEVQHDREEEPRIALATDGHSTRRMSGNPSLACELYQSWLSGRFAS